MNRRNGLGLKEGCGLNEKNDIIEFDLPDYEEPYPPFPDVKVTTFNKEDSYSRNRDIADRLYEKEKQKSKSKTRSRKTIRKIAALAAGLILSAVLITAAVGAFGERERQPSGLSSPVRKYMAEKKKEEDPFFAAAKVIPLLERIDEPDRTAQFHEDDYAVTINFTVKNTSNEEISFRPNRFYIRLKNGSVLSPFIADFVSGEKNFSYGDPESPWYGMHIPAGEQVSFSIKYYVSERNASQIKCIAYNVYKNLYADFADTDGYISYRVEKEFEKMTS